MIADPPGTWHAGFSEGDLAAVRNAIPESIRAGHARAARAQTEYADPDGDQDVYGAGMSRAVQKELAGRLVSLDSYREQFVPGSRRKLTYVGDALLFPHRVGKSMPRNHLRIRLNYLPENRRDLLLETGNVKYIEQALFDLPPETTGENATFAEVLESLESASQRVTLFVPYYSSTAAGIGAIYWGPARLNGKYLEFTAPERVTLERVPASASAPTTPVAQLVVPGFAAKERMRTPVRLREKLGQGTMTRET